jgi:tetratricopeptide (TPR) repeat protein
MAKGSALEQLKDYDEAIKEYDQAIKLSPQNSDYRKARARIIGYLNNTRSL